MTTEEIKEITRAVVLALREELTPSNKGVLDKLADIENSLNYDGIPIVNISGEARNNLVKKQDGLYARNNYVTTESSPVGEIIAFMGTIAPDHYLFCDGAEYAIGSYPSLEAFFVKQFGKVNHFGGNGTTTFALPDLRGEFLRGTGTNRHENQGHGAEVGEHQNSTMFSRIRVNEDGGLGIYNGTLTTPASEYDSTPHQTDVQSRFTADYYGPSSATVVSTYTSRPTNTSVMYCIKYEPTCVEERRFLVTRPDLWPENTEIDFGDGLYGIRRTGTITATAHTDSTVVLAEGGDFSIVDAGGTWEVDKDHLWWTHACDNDGVQVTTIFRDVAGKSINLATRSGAPRADSPFNVWVTYIKI